MKNHLISIGGVLFFALLGAGCQSAKPPVATDSSVTILVSAADTTKYCNGVDMDTDGYRKTISQEKSISLTSNQTESERAKSIIVAATTGSCQNVLKQLDITAANGTVHIPPIEGWAGISIAMCSCKPQVEVNALRIPGIKKIVWDAAP